MLGICCVYVKMRWEPWPKASAEGLITSSFGPRVYSSEQSVSGLCQIDFILDLLLTRSQVCNPVECKPVVIQPTLLRDSLRFKYMVPGLEMVVAVEDQTSSPGMTQLRRIKSAKERRAGFRQMGQTRRERARQRLTHGSQTQKCLGSRGGAWSLERQSKKTAQNKKEA